MTINEPMKVFVWLSKFFDMFANIPYIVWVIPLVFAFGTGLNKFWISYIIMLGFLISISEVRK